MYRVTDTSQVNMWVHCSDCFQEPARLYTNESGWQEILLPLPPPTSISSHIIFLLRNQRDQQTLVSACEPNFDCHHLTRDPAKPANNGSRSQLFLCGKCFFSQSLSWSERMLPLFYIYCQCMTIAIISVKENALDTSFLMVDNILEKGLSGVRTFKSSWREFKISADH